MTIKIRAHWIFGTAMTGCIVLARVIEAFRDAIDFMLGAEPMTLAWHVLKGPQFGLWAAAGVMFDLLWTHSGPKAAVAWLAAGVIVAWPVFEFVLRTLR